MLWLTTYRPNNVLSVSGGARYDYGYINISSHEDVYLADYLQKQGYTQEQIDLYKWNTMVIILFLWDWYVLPPTSIW